MPVFSPGRDKIFTAAAKVRFSIHGFPDFYALLGVQRDASPQGLEEAITSRGADLLAASFSRGGKGEFLTLLERHMNDFRPILLDKVARIAYDEQLRRHEADEPRALAFEAWKESHGNGNALSRGLQKASRGIRERLRAAFWESEYF
jgi:hypothetical protein